MAFGGAPYMTQTLAGVPRLYVAEGLSEGGEPALNDAQRRYIGAVLRLKPGDPIRVFNAAEGEWRAHVTQTKRAVALRCERHIASVKPPPDIDYVFAPLKHSR